MNRFPDLIRKYAFLHPEKKATHFEGRDFTYARFLARIQGMGQVLVDHGVSPGDRVAYLGQNSHWLVEMYYVPCVVGAILVPINYRLLPEDFEYIINHSGAKVVCAHSDYLEAVDGIRANLPDVETYVALEGEGEGWLDYEATLSGSGPGFAPVEIDESDLITINYTSVDAYVGDTVATIAIAGMVLGGLGNVWGAVVGGLFVGILEVF